MWRFLLLSLICSFCATPGLEARLMLGRASYELILHHEVSSRQFYDAVLSHPTVPPESSGVTIGIGYDLGYVSKDTFLADWEGYLAPRDLQALAACTGYIKDQARARLPGVRHIKIPWQAAEAVFQRVSLPRALRWSLDIFPNLETLPPDAIGCLVSLVYNRGASLEGARRREMLEISQMMEEGNYAAIPAKIREMKRLWRGKDADGLLRRREDEAKLLAAALAGDPGRFVSGFQQISSSTTIPPELITQAEPPPTPLELEEIRGQFFYNAQRVAQSLKERILSTGKRHVALLDVENLEDMRWLLEFEQYIVIQMDGSRILKTETQKLVEVDITDLDFDAYPPSEVTRILDLTENLLQTRLPSPLLANSQATKSGLQINQLPQP